MSEKIEILFNVPLPDDNLRTKSTVYPFEELTEGAMFRVPVTHDRANTIRARLSQRCKLMTKRSNQFRYEARRIMLDEKLYVGVWCFAK